MLEELARLGLLQLLLLDDVVEQLAATHKLHDEEQLLRRLDNLEELDDVRMPDQLQDINLSSDALDVGLAGDLALFKYFYRYLSLKKNRELCWSADMNNIVFQNEMKEFLNL